MADLADLALRVLTSARDGKPETTALAIQLAEGVLREQLAAGGRKARAGRPQVASRKTCSSGE